MATEKTITAPEPPAERTATPPTYAVGALKQDPDTQAVAVRTAIPDPNGNHDWGVMTTDHGGHYATWDEVAAWLDLPNTPVTGATK